MFTKQLLYQKVLVLPLLFSSVSAFYPGAHGASDARRLAVVFPDNDADLVPGPGVLECYDCAEEGDEGRWSYSNFLSVRGFFL